MSVNSKCISLLFFGNFLFHISEHIAVSPEEGKINALKLKISQKNREKHSFTVNIYRNEFIMEGPVINYGGTLYR